MGSIKISPTCLARPAVARPLVNAQACRSVQPQIRSVVASAVASAPASVETTDWESVAVGLEGKSPLEIMDHALATFGNEIAIAFSGAEDVALIEYAHLTGRKYRVFSLDTGRLNPETYQLFDAVEKHYGIRIEYTFPESQEVVDLVREKGMYSFYEDGHQECCRCPPVAMLTLPPDLPPACPQVFLHARIRATRDVNRQQHLDLKPVCHSGSARFDPSASSSRP